MNDNRLPGDKAVRRVQVMVVLWAIVFLISIVATGMTEKTGDSFLRGINRVYVFLGWQCAAVGIAVISFITVRRNKGTLPKAWQIGGIAPVCVYGLLLLLAVGVMIIALMTKPPALQ